MASQAAIPQATIPQAAIPQYGYDIVHTYPHDPSAFTEGLFYLNGFLYESTGLEQHSSIRKVRIETGEVVQRLDIPAQYFGEGIVNWHRHLISLTWKSHVGFVFDLATFKLQRQFQYDGEGWALTRDDKQLIMTNWIVRIDPGSGRVVGLVNLSGLLKPSDIVKGQTDVLNGIAYDAKRDRLFVTGKNWPKLFEIRLRRDGAAAPADH